MVRKIRRQTAEQKILARLGETYDRARGIKTQVIVILAIIVAAIVLLAVWQYQISRTREKSGEVEYESGNDVAKLEQAIADYPGTAAGGRMMLRLGRIFFNEGRREQDDRHKDKAAEKFKDAEKLFAKYLEYHGGTPFAILAGKSLADCKEELKDYAGAIAQYKKMIQQLEVDDRDSNFLPFFHFKVAQCLELSGKRQEALEAYRNVRANPYWLERAKERIFLLQNPSLMPKPKKKPPQPKKKKPEKKKPEKKKTGDAPEPAATSTPGKDEKPAAPAEKEHGGRDAKKTPKTK